MKLSEIAEYIVENYPDCCMACNNEVNKGCREEWYEESLIAPRIINIVVFRVPLQELWYNCLDAVDWLIAPTT